MNTIGNEAKYSIVYSVITSIFVNPPVLSSSDQNTTMVPTIHRDSVVHKPTTCYTYATSYIIDKTTDSNIMLPTIILLF